MALSAIYTHCTTEPLTVVPASASAAYSAWLSEIGVTETLNSLNGDDLIYVVDGIKITGNSTTLRMFYGTEGGIGLFFENPSSEVKTSVTLPVTGRWYDTQSPPDVRITCQSIASANRQSLNTRFAKSGSVVIIFAKTVHFSNEIEIVETAYRIETGLVQVVSTAVSGTNATLCVHTNAPLVSLTVAGAFSGTVGYRIALSFEFFPVAVQPHTVGTFAAGAYNPVQGKPKEALLVINLTDCAPYGLPGSLTTAGASLFEYKGKGRITGTVFEDTQPADTPLRRLVRLHREPDGAFVAATWSDAVTGEYVFNGIRPDCKYTVTSFDHTATYRAVVADRLIPEAV